MSRHRILTDISDSEGNKYTYRTSGKQSWFAFWSMGSLFGLACLAGSVTGTIQGINNRDTDSGMFIFFGFMFLMGAAFVLAVALTVTAVCKNKKDPDYSLPLPAAKAKNATGLMRDIYYGRCNVITIKAADGAMDLFGFRNNFNIEIKTGDRIYALTDPRVTQNAPVLIPTTLERFPTTRRRLLNGDAAIRAITKLNKTSSVQKVLDSFASEDITEEYNELKGKDVLLRPSVPLVFNMEETEKEREAGVILRKYIR